MLFICYDIAKKFYYFCVAGRKRMKNKKTIFKKKYFYFSTICYTKITFKN